MCHTASVVPVFIRGIGIRSAVGAEPASVLDRLCRAEPAFAPYQPFAEARIRAPFAAAIPDEELPAGIGAADDRGTRLLYAAVCDALSDAGGSPDLRALLPYVPARIALVTGTSSSGIGPLCDAMASGSPRSQDDTRYSSATRIVAQGLGIGGPVLTICNVCASGALAIAEAASLLEAGLADIAIAAGFDPLEPFVAAGFDALGTLVEQPRPFRSGRRGFILGEGAAALVMSLQTDSTAPRRGVVRGWGISADAHHITAPHPEGDGLVLAIDRALRCAGLGPGAIGAINAHGTGTVFNDAMESKAFSRAFGPRAGSLPVYTLKGTLGHTLGAAGAIEAVVSLLAMQRDVVPPTATSGDVDPACDIDLVTDRPRSLRVDCTLSVSAGFGGTNCALLLSPPSHDSR